MALSASLQREMEIHNYIKSISKKSKWQFRGWFIFKKLDPFLISANFFVGGKMNCLNGSLSFKPLNIDNLYCEITGQDDYFKSSPLSYKVNSNGMLYPYNYFYFKIDSVSEDKLDLLLMEIDEKVEEIRVRFTDMDNYYEFVQDQKERNGLMKQQAYLTNLVYLKKYDQLLNYIDYCKRENITSGQSQTNVKNPELSWDYYDKLIEYVKRIHLSN